MELPKWINNINERLMDSIYASFVRQIAGTLITSEAKDIHTAIIQTKQQEALSQEITILKKQDNKKTTTKKEIRITF